MAKVWIDQSLCTGDGLCEEICGAIFQIHDDGLAYVKEPEWEDILNGGDSPLYTMAQGQVDVPEEMLEDVVDASEECPGECIFIETEDDSE